MNHRIREVRDSLDMTRAAFGEKLGVSGDVINNLERGRVEPKESIINLIVRTYGVSEEWLRTGKGEMFDAEWDPVRDLKLRYGLSDDMAALLEKLARLEPSQQEAIISFVNTFVKEKF